ncbi:class I SAM-dependent methyltransferase [Nannocystis poenicansa]|uniref:Class I SAM-dependent methyltransferase n=1 Tax=Nannocystis punicea TaxID=2995304 RepID=A0ABY7H314_9BACT|nr:class I SAM-dependent methyltransferase [Nannocystis poenicansa]WAS93656.1 class I SAM-dependent methyltransferase [Nannocystis poenicansa]
MHLDFGTGDGAFALRRARSEPSTLVIGVDASAEGLREPSRKAAGKPARGGLANVLFGLLPLERAPGELVGLVDALTVLLPWGSLLRAVALPEAEGLARLRGLCKPGASLQVVFGYGPGDPLAVQALPGLQGEVRAAGLVQAYAAAGFEVTARSVGREEVGELPTTWAKKLAYSNNEREFVALTGVTR